MKKDILQIDFVEHRATINADVYCKAIDTVCYPVEWCFCIITFNSNFQLLENIRLENVNLTYSSKWLPLIQDFKEITQTAVVQNDNKLKEQCYFNT